MIDRPFAPACERNQAPIFQALRDHLPATCNILEIASGTGQHAAYFLSRQPHWMWQCSDLPGQLPGIRAWTADLPEDQSPPPIALDVLKGPWPPATYDALFSANSLHIMPIEAVASLFQRLPTLLTTTAEASALFYGPFNVHGTYSSPSNAEFDLWLKARDSAAGIRDKEWIVSLADKAGLALTADLPMPANNRMLVFKRPALRNAGAS